MDQCIEKLREAFTQFFLNFPDRQSPFFPEYQKTVESFLMMLINIREHRFDESLNRAGQFVEHSFQAILDILGLIATNPDSDYVTTANVYYALSRKSDLGKNRIIRLLMDLLRCAYKVRGGIEHDLKKIDEKSILIHFLVILQLFLLIKLNEIYASNKMANLSTKLGEIENFLVSISVITNNSRIFNQPYINEFSRILNLRDEEEVDQKFNQVIIPNQDLQDMQRLLDFIYENLADFIISREIFTQNILSFEIIDTYPGAREIFPYEEISPFLIQNIKTVAEEVSDDAFKFGGPSLDDLEHQRFVYLPEICNDILQSIGDGKKIKIEGRSGLGKTTLAKMIGFFYSRNVFKINFETPLENIPAGFQNPVYYFDFFSQDAGKIRKALHTLKFITDSQTPKKNQKNVLIIVDNVQLMADGELILVDSLVCDYKMIVLIKTGEEIARKNQRDAEEEQRQAKKQKVEEISFNLSENKEYLKDIIAGILSKANPDVDPEPFIAPLFNRSIFGAPVGETGKIEENLWTVSLVARILHKSRQNNESTLSINQILADFERFHKEIQIFIITRFLQFQQYLHEIKSPPLAFSEKIIKDHLELILLLIALLSQLEIPLEKSFFRQMQPPNEARFPLLSQRLILIGYNFELAVHIIDFLTLKGELIAKEGYNKDTEYLLPHQKLSLILKNALLHPFSFQEILDFQAEFFTWYLDKGKNFGKLLTFLENFAIRNTSPETDLARLYPADIEISQRQVEFKFYLHRLVKNMNPSDFLLQLSKGFLDQSIAALIVLANMYDEELRDFQGIEPAKTVIPDPHKKVVREFFEKMFPNGNIYENVIANLFQRTLQSQRNEISLKDLDNLHYLWFHYTKIPETKWLEFLTTNKEKVVELIGESDPFIVLWRTKIEFPHREKKDDRPQRIFYRSLFAVCGNLVLKAFAGIDHMDYDVLLKILKGSQFGTPFTELIKLCIKNDFHYSSFSRTLEVVYHLSKHLGIDPNCQPIIDAATPSFVEINQILLDKLEKANLEEIVVFFDISLNLVEKHKGISLLFEKFFLKNRDILITRIQEYSAKEIFETFERIFALNNISMAEARSSFLRDLFQGTNFLNDKIKQEMITDLTDLRDLCSYLEQFNNILHFQSEIEIKNTVSRFLSEFLENCLDLSTLEEVQKIFRWPQIHIQYSAQFRTQFIHTFFRRHFENILPLLQGIFLKKIANFFVQVEILLQKSRPTQIEGNEGTGSIWPDHTYRSRLLKEVVLPRVIWEINGGRFDCLEDLFQSTTLDELIPEIRPAIEATNEYRIVGWAFIPANAKKQLSTEMPEDATPYYIPRAFRPEFDKSLYKILKRLKKLDFEHSIEEVRKTYRAHVTRVLEAIKRLIKDWFGDFEKNDLCLSFKSPHTRLEFIILLMRYAREVGVSILEKESKALTILREKITIFITYGWFVFALLHSENPPSLNPALQTRLTAIWQEQMITLNSVQFELLCLMAYVAWQRGFAEEDYSRKFKLGYFPKKVFEDAIDIRATLTSVKIYEGGLTTGEGLNPANRDGAIQKSFKQNYWLFPPVRPLMEVKEVTQHSFSSCYSYLGNSTIHFVSKRLCHFYGSVFLDEYFLREQERLWDYLFDYVASPQHKWGVIEGKLSDLPSFHGYLCYIKLAFTLKMVFLYQKKDPWENIRTYYFQLLSHGQIPRSPEDMSKEKSELEEKVPQYDHLEKQIEHILAILGNYIEFTTKQPNLASKLFFDGINFGELVFLAIDFVGFYTPILKMLLVWLDKYFEETPSLFENVEDLSPNALFTYLYFLYQVLTNDPSRDFSLILTKYKHCLSSLMLAAGPTSLRGLLLRNFSKKFVEHLLRELESTILKLLEQGNPFLNMEKLVGRGNPGMDYFLNHFKGELLIAFEHQRIDTLEF